MPISSSPADAQGSSASRALISLGRGFDQVQCLLAVADRPARNYEAVIHKLVHESRVLVPGICARIGRTGSPEGRSREVGSPGFTVSKCHFPGKTNTCSSALAPSAAIMDCP